MCITHLPIEKILSQCTGRRGERIRSIRDSSRNTRRARRADGCTMIDGTVRLRHKQGREQTNRYEKRNR